MKASRAVLVAAAVASAAGLATCGANNGGGTTTPPSASPTPPVATPDPTLSPEPTPTPIVTTTPPPTPDPTTPTPEPTPQQISWGQPFTVTGGAGAQVGSVNLTNWQLSTSAVNGQAPHFGRFLTVQVSALALEDGFSPSDFDFIAQSGGQVFEQNPLAGGNPLPSQYLTHGQEVSGVLVFDVPATGPINVLYSPGPESGVVASWTTS